MIGVIATVQIKAGMERRWEEIFVERRKAVLAEEPGCLAYDLFRSKADPTLYTVIERYDSDESFKTHLSGSTGHEEMMACFDGAPTIVQLTPVPGAV